MRIARERKADLIVLGSRERHGPSILVNLTEDTVLHARALRRAGGARAARQRMSPGDHRIRVDVETNYLDEQSDPRESRYVFSYTITIRNEGQVPARLLTRHWVITDANGKVQEVRGDGVVGEQPYLKPGQGFRYSSGAVLETPVGVHAGQLPDARRRRRALRRADRSRSAWRCQASCTDGRYAIGDVQGCLRRIQVRCSSSCGFRPTCDRLWFVGDLVNRGPDSLETLRFVRALGENATVVLGNHDLHLLAVAARRAAPEAQRHPRAGARRRATGTSFSSGSPPGRSRYARPAIDLLVHAGLVPQWSVATALALAREVSGALARRRARRCSSTCTATSPERWDDSLERLERLRFTINVLTRLRFCSADGRIDRQVSRAAADGAPALRRRGSSTGRA